MVYFPALDPLFRAAEDLIDVIEVEPQPYWLRLPGTPPSYKVDERFFQHLDSFRQPKLLHSIGMPVGGTVAPEPQQMPHLQATIQRLNPPWVSEHLAFIQARHQQGIYNTGYQLAPLQTPETLQRAVATIQQFKAKLPVPFAFENTPSYLKPQPFEIPDGEFLAQVAEQADCGILLDLHNLWCNELNGRQPVSEVLASLPPDRVWEIHLAGGEPYQGYWLDAHSGLVPPQLLELCHQWLPHFSQVKAIIFEIIPGYLIEKGLTTDNLLWQLEQLQQLWRQRQRTLQQPAAITTHTGIPPAPAMPAPPQQLWEHQLASLMNNRAVASPLAEFTSEPAIPILQQLASSVRTGAITDLLTLSYRLLRLQLGKEATEQLLTHYCQQTLPHPFAAEEALHFSDFLQQQLPEQLYLADILACETAAIRAMTSGDDQQVSCSYNPTILLQNLQAGILPAALPAGQFQLRIKAPDRDNADQLR